MHCRYRKMRTGSRGREFIASGLRYRHRCHCLHIYPHAAPPILVLKSAGSEVLPASTRLVSAAIPILSLARAANCSVSRAKTLMIGPKTSTSSWSTPCVLNCGVVTEYVPLVAASCLSFSFGISCSTTSIPRISSPFCWPIRAISLSLLSASFLSAPKPASFASASFNSWIESLH